MYIFFFSSLVGVKESNEVEVMKIKEALTIFKGNFTGRLIIKSNSMQSNHGFKNWPSMNRSDFVGGE